jgi:hypothetical protein
MSDEDDIPDAEAFEPQIDSSTQARREKARLDSERGRVTVFIAKSIEVASHPSPGVRPLTLGNSGASGRSISPAFFLKPDIAPK